MRRYATGLGGCRRRATRRHRIEGAAMIALLCIIVALLYAGFWIRSLVGLTAVLLRGH